MIVQFDPVDFWCDHCGSTDPIVTRVMFIERRFDRALVCYCGRGKDGLAGKVSMLREHTTCLSETPPLGLKEPKPSGHKEQFDLFHSTYCRACVARSLPDEWIEIDTGHLAWVISFRLEFNCSDCGEPAPLPALVWERPPAGSVPKPWPAVLEPYSPWVIEWPGDTWAREGWLPPSPPVSKNASPAPSARRKTTPKKKVG